MDLDQPRVKRIKLSDSSIQKRAPLHPPGSNSPNTRKASGRTDEDSGLCIYLTRQSVLPHIAERISKALEDGKNSKNGVQVRAMGAAIEKAVHLAVELQRRGYVLGILTGTAEVVDDVIPDDHDMQLDSQTRQQSTIELRVRRS